MKICLIFLIAAGICLFFLAEGLTYESVFWKNISKEITDVNFAWVDSQDQNKILLGSDKGLFKTSNGGESWKAVLIGINKRVNSLYVDGDSIYAACSSGLFFSSDGGKTWKRIFSQGSEEENDCLYVVKIKNREIYLATQTGLFRSFDNGLTWARFKGRLGRLPVKMIAVDGINDFVYSLTQEGVYRSSDNSDVKRVFVSRPEDSQASEDYETDQSEETNTPLINHISVETENTQRIYLATNKGVYKSEDSGENWQHFPDVGLLSQNIHFVFGSEDSGLLAVIKSGVFIYDKVKWQEVSLRLSMQDACFLTVDNRGNIYVAGDSGLFVTENSYFSANNLRGYRYGPGIKEVQSAAVEYAQVIDPAWIASQRRLSRLKAILPGFSLDYDKTVSAYSNSQFTRYNVGPRDWGISLTWDLSDLIWSEQDRLIDSQVRLMIKLRQDILDEVTRVYFERCRLVSALEQEQNNNADQEMRIEELTALLNGLTGGYFSSAGEDCSRRVNRDVELN